jgi:hypothetical protein
MGKNMEHAARQLAALALTLATFGGAAAAVAPALSSAPAAVAASPAAHARANIYGD